MKLDELQTLFQDSILSFSPLIQSELTAPPRGSIDARFAIYADGYYSRLESTLTSDYSNLCALMGEKKFNKMCKKYISKYPSYGDTLNYYGEHLSHFLKETEIYQHKGFLAEVAAFDWAEGMALVSSDIPILKVADLQTLAPDKWAQMAFQLHPSCHMLGFDWNSLSLIEGIRDKRLNWTAKKRQTTEYVLLWRQQQGIRYLVFDVLKFDLLKELQKGASFGELCEYLSLKMPEEEVAGFIAKELYVWVENQFLCLLVNN